MHDQCSKGEFKSHSPLCVHETQHHYDVAHLGPYLDGTPALPLGSESLNSFCPSIPNFKPPFCRHASPPLLCKPLDGTNILAQNGSLHYLSMWNAFRKYLEDDIDQSSGFPIKAYSVVNWLHQTTDVERLLLSLSLLDS